MARNHVYSRFYRARRPMVVYALKDSQGEHRTNGDTFQTRSSAEPPAPSARTVARAAGLVGLATAISRVLGLLREMVVAHYFGAGRFTDAFYVAYRIPNLLRDLFAEGALSSAFVPTFVAQLKEGGRSRAWRLANLVINAVAVILGIVTLTIYFGARWFVYLQAAGFAREPDKFELTVQMTRIMSPFLLFVAPGGPGDGDAQCLRFLFPARDGALGIQCLLHPGRNSCSGPFMPGFGLDPIVSMAIGALIGGAAQFFVQIPAAYREGYRYRPHWIFPIPACVALAGSCCLESSGSPPLRSISRSTTSLPRWQETDRCRG